MTAGVRIVGVVASVVAAPILVVFALYNFWPTGGLFDFAWRLLLVLLAVVLGLALVGAALYNLMPSLSWQIVRPLLEISGAIFLVAVLLALAGYNFWPYLSASGTGHCTAPRKGGVATAQQAKWKLVGPKGKKIIVAMDDWADEPRRGSSFVRVLPTKKNPTKKPLPQGLVRAFLLDDLSTGERSAELQTEVLAVRSPDGRTVRVALCALSAASDRNSPGRYKGTVRVATRNALSAEIPVELTIKARRLNVAFLALLISLIGACLTAFNTRSVNLTQAERDKKKKTQLTLDWAPFLSGLVAGLAAAFVVYADDPTWGAHLGADTAKLFTVTFAAASAGLTVTAAPARAAQRRLAGN
jgi:hypothetical protein